MLKVDIRKRAHAAARTRVDAPPPRLGPVPLPATSQPLGALVMRGGARCVGRRSAAPVGVNACMERVRKNYGGTRVGGVVSPTEPLPSRADPLSQTADATRERGKTARNPARSICVGLFLLADVLSAHPSAPKRTQAHPRHKEIADRVRPVKTSQNNVRYGFIPAPPPATMD